MSLSHLLGQGVLRVTGAAAPPGWWDPSGEGLCVWGAWQAKGVADYATSLVDLSGNGNNLTEGVGAVTWDAVNGWQFDLANSDYLETGFIPANDQSQSMLLQFVQNGRQYLCGVLDNATPDQFSLRQVMPAGNAAIFYNGDGANRLTIAGGSIASGNLAVAGTLGFINGVQQAGVIGAYGGVMARDVWLGGINNAGAPLMGDCDVVAFVVYDCVLTPAQVASVRTAMAAL